MLYTFLFTCKQYYAGIVYFNANLRQCYAKIMHLVLNLKFKTIKKYQ